MFGNLVAVALPANRKADARAPTAMCWRPLPCLSLRAMERRKFIAVLSSVATWPVTGRSPWRSWRKTVHYKPMQVRCGRSLLERGSALLAMYGQEYSPDGANLMTAATRSATRNMSQAPEKLTSVPSRTAASTLANRRTSSSLSTCASISSILPRAGCRLQTSFRSSAPFGSFMARSARRG
jgi:hypothetical protein